MKLKASQVDQPLNPLRGLLLFSQRKNFPLGGLGGSISKGALLLLSLFIAGCSEGPRDGADAAEKSAEEKTKIVTTTGMIGDAVKHLAGDFAEVKVLMGPGVDPHLYKATQGDISALTKAGIVVYNGLHLEGKMTEIFRKLSSSKTTISMGELLPEASLINTTDYAGAYDPHIWFDVDLWSEAVAGLAKELQQAMPAHDSAIAVNADDYLNQLQELQQFVKKKTGEIPEANRVMITAHDAFKYFGEAYGLEVRGLQGISTASEYGIRDVSNLVNYIVDNKIPAIFVESSVPKRSVEAVIEGARERGHNLKLGGELYSDAMGAAGTEEGTYTGMVKHNVRTIADALR